MTANRTGEEERGGKKMRYTGKSRITPPDARILYRANEENDEIGVVEIDVQLARNKRLNEYNDLFADRRVEFYNDLIRSNS